MKKPLNEMDSSPSATAIKAFAKVAGITNTAQVDALATGLEALSKALQDKPDLKNKLVAAFQTDDFKNLATAATTQVKKAPAEVPQQEGIHEQVSNNVEAFVNYLFESKKEDDEEEDKKKKKVSDEEHDERKHEDASVAALEKQLDKIPSGYWKRVNTTDKAVELVIKAVLDRLSFSSPSKHSQLRSKLLSSLRKY